ncbi:DUF998 domain-containing protein [Nocardia sp. NPDC051030]|uniref:DUF998 domain-containing protein n=1 Tax=Nocardia sp. NPDC051030 TaxID=3155162 RepID=UPI003449552C
MTTTRWLLTCGVVAGPLFVSAVLVQAAARDGFRIGHHPLSLLSLGGLGWIQIANFGIAGALYVVAAVGVRRAVPDAGWLARAVAGIGVGLIVAGVCVTDAGAGFPPGTPDRAPERVSWHGVLHEVGFGVTILSWLALCVICARRGRERREWGMVGGSAGTLAVVLVVVGWPDMGSLSVRLLVATAIQFGFVAVVLLLCPRMGVGFDVPHESRIDAAPGKEWS